MTRAIDTPATLREALRVMLGHASPRILVALVALTVAARCALGGFGFSDVVVVAVVLLLWPLQEWALHVFLLHYRPLTIRGRVFDFDIPKKHRAHHRDPWNPEILFIPAQSFLYTLPAFVVWFLLAPTPAVALTGILMYLALSLHYEIVHFLIHTRVPPRTRYYRHLWRNHRLHHFKNEHHWYGVTRVEGDHLLGTAPDATTVEVSPTARTLETSA